ncbi:hypothetical protein DPX16_1747 [Anabarilius grahami]|uniref:Uncharacterized protein n=1 Tax=Anabarilius grahami TaxID=495550 RepID=A0A3N0YP23_ANAGA|nr:hypothetical protein DPX16_1747 [Anabarilius grahami]
MGYKPLLLLQKEGNGKKPKITSLTPRCELDPLATQHLSKMTAFYELVCAGWKASKDTVLTLTLTPCDEQGTSGEAGPEILVEEARAEDLMEEAGLEGPAVEMAGLVAKAGLECPGVEVEGPVEEARLEGPAVEMAGLVVKVGLESAGVEAEGLVEEAGLEGPGVEAEGLVEEAGLEGPSVEAGLEGPSVEAEGLMENAGLEGLMEEAGLEGPAVENEGLVEEAELEGPAVEMAGLLEKVGLKSPDVEAEGLMEEAGEIQRSKKDCSYHTGLGVYPIRSALKERVRKGQTELLIDWEPCAACKSFLVVAEEELLRFVLKNPYVSLELNHEESRKKENESSLTLRSCVEHIFMMDG